MKKEHKIISLNEAIRTKIDGTKYDRRRKLTPKQKDMIRRLYKQSGWSYRTLAIKFGVFYTTIQFTIHPEANNKKQYGYSTEEKTIISKRHREYKLNLLKKGKI